MRLEHSKCLQNAHRTCDLLRMELIELFKLPVHGCGSMLGNIWIHLRPLKLLPEIRTACVLVSPTSPHALHAPCSQSAKVGQLWKSTAPIPSSPMKF